MDKVIALLREKNEFLEKFFAVNETELINFADGDFNTVEAFYQARDKILDLIAYVDERIEKENAAVPASRITAEHRVQAEQLLKIKDEWVTAILAQDLRVLEYIEQEKSAIIRELRAAKQTRRAVGAYAAVERIALLDEKP